MTCYETILLDGIDEFRECKHQWDDLWQRSDVTAPTARAELIAQWHEHFAGDSRFLAILILRDGQPVVGLPLVEKTINRVLTVGALPSNEWSGSGDLLLDPSIDIDDALDTLVGAVNDLPWKLLWLEQVPAQYARWSSLIDALNRSGVSVDFHEQYRIGWLDIDDDWDAYREVWSKNHRRGMTKSTKRLQKFGEASYRLDTEFETSDVADLMRQAFEIENKSWKGEAGTSILKTDRMPEFFIRQAELLAQHQHLDLAWLTSDGQPIAFEYAMRAKGVYHSFKVGYDAQYASASPGQLLMFHLLEDFYHGTGYRAIDCMGPLSDAVARWKPRTYPVGRLVIAPQRPLSQAIFFGYENIWPQIRRFRV